MSNVISIFPINSSSILDEQADDDQGDDQESESIDTNDLTMNELDDILGSASGFDEQEQPNTIELPPQRRCVPHLLNLSATDFENALTPQAKSALIGAINKAHSLCTFTHRSSHAKTLCYEIIGCVLQVPCVTRWNSRYDAVARICNPNIKPKVNSLIQRLSSELSSAAHLQILSNADWVILNDYVRVMEPIARSLDILQCEKNACQGFILPTLTSMRYRVMELNGSNLLQAFKRAALDTISKRFERHLNVCSPNKELVLAAVSHPLFKTTFIEDPVDEINARELLRSECMKKSNESETQIASNCVTPNTATEEQCSSFFVTFNRTNARQNSIESEVDTEIGRYLNDIRREEAILDEYPLIKRIFFEHNTTLASSVPIERVFSQSNLIFRNIIFL